MIKKRDLIFELSTPASTFVLKADTAECVYYGRRLSLGGSIASICGSSRRIFSSPGGGDYSEYSIQLLNADGGFAADFKFVRAKITVEKREIPGLPFSYGEGRTLELKYMDASTRVALYLYYTVFSDSDVIAASARLVNGSRKPVRIRRLMSLQLDLAGCGFDVVTLGGMWGPERRRYPRSLGAGIFVNDSKSGCSQRAHNPFVMAVSPQGAYAFNFVYSGNHKELFECDGHVMTRILVGLNDFMFDWNLAPGEEFNTPEAVMCYADSEEECCARMRAFVASHIVRGKWKTRERPVCVNSVGVKYPLTDVDALRGEAVKAAETGAELFVLDDFTQADEDAPDWYKRVEKDDGALASLAKEVRERGLMFGIRIEPEVIGEDNEFLRTHPNFAMKIPGRAPVRIRNRLMLNFADERVQNYAVRIASEAITRSGASFVRWDFNRTMTDCFGKGVPAGEYFHRYMLGYYRVLSKLVKKFPSVLFEGCAEGGGRCDLGLLCFFPQIRVRDCTDARDRIELLDCVTHAYPSCTFCSSVSQVPDLYTGTTSSLDVRFLVACGSVLGYDIGLNLLSEEERKQIAAQIAFYRTARKLFQFGERYRLGEGKAIGFMDVSADKGTAIAVIFLKKWSPGDLPTMRFKGLNPAACYDVTARGREGAKRVAGDVLMYADCPLRDLFCFEENVRYSGGVQAKLYFFKKVKN